MSLLQVKNLIVEFPSRHGTLRALDEVTAALAEHFPATADNLDELPNAVVEVKP